MKQIKGCHLNGVLVVDKPRGITSYDVVRFFKRLVPGVRIGYLGTLDPIATGVLPLLLGEGTKLAPFLEGGRKVYDAVMHLGVTTDTQDCEGKVIKRCGEAIDNLSVETLKGVLKSFLGRITQRPPLYSALKRHGQPLYRLARKGEVIDPPVRGIDIYTLEIKSFSPPFIGLYVECSKGTYIRTLVHDIGEAIGYGAHLVELRRLRNGPFGIEDALTVEEIEQLVKEGKIKERVIPLFEALTFLPFIEVNKEVAMRISKGQTVFLATLSIGGNGGNVEGFVRIVQEDTKRMLAVGTVNPTDEGYLVRPLRVFHDRLCAIPPLWEREVASIAVEQGG